MSILEKHISEVSFKIDHEDLEIISKTIETFASKVPSNYVERLENLMHVSLLKDAHLKFQQKLLEKKGNKKEFIVKLKPAVAFSVYQLVLAEEKGNDLRKYETICRMKFRNMLYEKLRSL